MRVLTVKLDAELAARLSSLATRRGASKSEIVRQILRSALCRDDGRLEGSFLELASDICGSVSGPEDLSSNPEHMRTYGR